MVRFVVRNTCRVSLECRLVYLINMNRFVATPIPLLISFAEGLNLVLFNLLLDLIGYVINIEVRAPLSLIETAIAVLVGWNYFAFFQFDSAVLARG